MTANLTGLTVAWGGTVLLISPLLSSFRDPSRPMFLVIGTGYFWALAALVIAIVLFWEKRPISSLWLQRFRRQSLAWAGLLLVFNYSLFLPAGEWVRRSFGLPGFSAGMEEIIRFPFWYRVVAVVGAGIVEELLFRGYTVTRLAELTGRTWLAALLALAGFSALHIPQWGWGFVIGGLLGGAAAMAFFIWRKDLLALMIFHTTTDAIGIVIAPMFSDWWNAL